jgi:2-polyprenyl-6-methoxyphenol hydroxylase-like FAD-dependent oxidoreductase
MASHRQRHDVVVVGARAAGDATALLLARLGHDVVMLDRAVFPSDTLSTQLALKLREIVEQSRARSAGYDILTNRVPVAIKVATS